MLGYDTQITAKILSPTGHSDDSLVTAVDITSNGKLLCVRKQFRSISLMNFGQFNIVQTFAKTEAGVGIRFVNVFK